MPRSYGFDHFTVTKKAQPQPQRGKKPLDRPRGGKHKEGAQHRREAVESAGTARAQVHAQAAAAHVASARGRARGVPAGTPPPLLDAGAALRRGLRDTWTLAGEHARGLREGAEQVLRAGRELVRLPLDLARALRGAAHEG